MTTERDKMNIAYTYMEKGRAEGRAEGLKVGEKRGEKKGEKRGRAAGIEEGKVQTARNLLQMGMDVGFVAEATGLEEGRVRELEATC